MVVIVVVELVSGAEWDQNLSYNARTREALQAGDISV